MNKLLKSLILFAVVALSFSSVSVKAQAFGKGDLVLNGGIGFGSVYGYDYGVGGASMWPTIFASGELGIVKIKEIGVISAGGEMAFRHISIAGIDYHSNEFYIGPRGAFHLTMLKVENLDVYGGVSFGLRFYSEPTYVGVNNYGRNTFTSAYGGLFVGGRYYFSEGFGVFSELSYDITIFKLGVVFKF